MAFYQFEAMDATGREIKDIVEASTEEDVQAKIRQMGCFVTKISKVRKLRQRGSKTSGGELDNSGLFDSMREPSQDPLDVEGWRYPQKARDLPVTTAGH